MHNGVLHEGSPEASDTMMFVRDHLWKMNSVKLNKISSWVATQTFGSRILIFDAHENKILMTGDWEEKDGVYYSNLRHEAPKRGFSSHSWYYQDTDDASGWVQDTNQYYRRTADPVVPYGSSYNGRQFSLTHLARNGCAYGFFADEQIKEDVCFQCGYEGWCIGNTILGDWPLLGDDWEVDGLDEQDIPEYTTEHTTEHTTDKEDKDNGTVNSPDTGREEAGEVSHAIYDSRYSGQFFERTASECPRAWNEETKSIAEDCRDCSWLWTQSCPLFGKGKQSKSDKKGTKKGTKKAGN